MGMELHSTGTFCYDADCEEYSVVVAYETQTIYVVDCKTGKERKLKNAALPNGQLDFKLFNREAGKVVCGVPHWVVRFHDFQNSRVQGEILYFDNKEEKFKQMARPNQGGGEEKYMLGLATLEGERQLGIVLHHLSTSSLEVWVMKEYGEPESWTNLFVIPYLSDIASLFGLMDVLGFMPNGELLIQSLDIWAHDLENGTSRMIQIRDGVAQPRYVVVEYEPSLISNPRSEKARNSTPKT
ncbi:F-box/kelch-repeat protein At3g23880-like [Chenopodium quinoa]|uniref:F-box/kelch-repeat protein At3g23880-like n=1 Tax=Chenopodium quinoa TaxID=63459 RepID=UPI000B78C272|nr:F-box/kelch-repeat protein At3g23880-like [Chenopodium quinoa]